MMFALSQRYETELSLAEVAAEIGLAKDEFLKAADRIDPKFHHFIRQVQRSTVPRDRFEAAFPDLAAAFALTSENRSRNTVAGS